MSLNELNKGFHQYIYDRFTQEEKKRFFQLISKHENEIKVKEYLLQQINAFPEETRIDNVDFEKIYTNIINNIESENKSFNYEKIKKPVNLLLKIAAVSLIFVITFFIIHKIYNSPHEAAFEAAFNEIKAPLGTTSEIILPDGSLIWLNAGSRLRYNMLFGSKNRTLELEGEAYFTVAKNKSIPFLVITDKIEIKAVGTEFNVKAYKDEGTIEAILIKGKILISRIENKDQDVNEITLNPNQKVTFIKENASLNVKDIQTLKDELSPRTEVKNGKLYITPETDPMPEIAWKDNRLIIKSETMERLIVKLERKYDVDIIMESEYLRNYKFSGTLEDESLQQVLDVIQLSAPINYDIKGKIVVLTENEKLKKRFQRYLKSSEN